MRLYPTNVLNADTGHCCEQKTPSMKKAIERLGKWYARHVLDGKGTGRWRLDQSWRPTRPSFRKAMARA